MRMKGKSCPACGTPNDLSWTFCVKCGGSLAEAAIVERTDAPVTPPRGPAPEPKTWEELWWAPGTERRKLIDRTANGLTLLAIVLLLSWFAPIRENLLFLLPLAILSLAGAVFVILGRDGFGSVHARNVLVGVALWFAGFALLFWSTLGLTATLLAATSPNPGSPGAILSSLDGVLVLGGVAVFVAGLAWVLFAHALLRWSQRAFLYGFLIASLVLYVVTSRMLHDAVALLVSGQVPQALLIVQDAQRIATLGFVPNALLVGGYAVALTRIHRREIPQPPARAPWTGLPAPSPVAAGGALGRFRECPSCRFVVDSGATECFMCGHRFAATAA